MPFWEYEMLVNDLNDYLKEKNEKEGTVNKEYENKMGDPSSMMNKYKSSINPNMKIPSMSNLTNFKMPSMR